MKTVYSIFFILGFLAVMTVLPPVYIGAYMEGSYWYATGFLVVWFGILLATWFACLKEGGRRVGEATGVLRKSEYYKLLKQFETPKGLVILTMSRDGTLSASIYNNRDSRPLAEGRWYRPDTLDVTSMHGVQNPLYLVEVKDEVAVAVLNKGYLPQWSA